MANNPYDNFDTLLHPQRLIPAREVLADRSLIPDERGVYGWWFNCGLPGVPLDGTLRSGEHHLLYVGIAPRAPSKAGSESASTLQRRICRNHLGNRIASSTLRRSLAWLLKAPLQFQISWNAAGKAIMSREDEDRLTGWMAVHAAMSFVRAEEPWQIETKLITEGPKLPLNIRDSAHPFRQRLLTLRSGKASSTDL
ncbi:hypothetical protein NKG95_33665 [Mesorhizobium sp. M1423]|uniref:GIY-YIG nuclease family protein n=1 Tax=Mesorhizobium sp. M1423 TaxID=2957101 RepID=UPI003338F8CD